MNTIQSIKSAAINGHVSLEAALKIATSVENERTATKELLKKCEKQVGMYLGEEINQHLADMEGSYFNATDYHYERPVGEQ